MSDDAALLVTFLNAQRTRAVGILEGLGDEQLKTPVLPCGWTPLGLIEHLGHAERHWFQEVMLGSAPPLPWAEESGDDDRPEGGGFTTDRSVEMVFGFYGSRSSARTRSWPRPRSRRPPRGRHGQGDESQVVDLRFVVLHMIEETARHLGHLDAARELLDGRTGLGQDDL